MTKSMRQPNTPTKKPLETFISCSNYRGGKKLQSVSGDYNGKLAMVDVVRKFPHKNYKF